MGDTIVVPGFETSWEDFCLTHPPGSVAVDGYVKGRSRINAEGTHALIDHHDDPLAMVDRDSLYSSARQFLTGLRTGLYDYFIKDGELSLWANHADEDVCLLAWLAGRAAMLSGTITQEQLPIERFVDMAAIMDTTAGAYPYDPKLPEMEAMAWIFDPYNERVYSGELRKPENRHNAELQIGIINEVGERLDHHFAGDGKQLELDTRHELEPGGPGWHRIIEIGKHARIGALAREQDDQGRPMRVNAYLLSRQISPDNWQHVFGKRSKFVPLPLHTLAERMNELEPGWGGSSTNIIGSPRIGGSRYSPQALSEITNNVIANGSQH